MSDSFKRRMDEMNAIVHRQIAKDFIKNMKSTETVWGRHVPPPLKGIARVRANLKDYRRRIRDAWAVLRDRADIGERY